MVKLRLILYLVITEPKQQLLSNNAVQKIAVDHYSYYYSLLGLLLQTIKT